MRAIAIIAILIYHLPGYTYDFYDINKLGIDIDSSVLRELSKYFGLGLFIFISGHLANLKSRSFSDISTTKEYIANKVIRIFPLYYLALLIFCRIYNIHDPLQVIVHFLGLQMVFASRAAKPLPTLWFIGLILIYYAAYIIFWTKKLRVTIRASILVMLPVIIFMINRAFHIMDLRIVLYYGIFILGLYSGRSDLFRRISWAQTGITVTAFGLMVALSGDLTFATRPFSSVSSFLMINFLMFLFINLTYKGCLFLSEKIKPHRIVEIVSYSSFCMFLFHRPVWSYMLKVLKAAQIAEGSIVSAGILALAGIPAIIVLSYSIQRIYDRLVPAR